MTFLTLSPLSTEGWASSWGREVGHHIFNLVTIKHRGLGQFLGVEVGRRIFNLVIIKHRGLGQFFGEGSRSPHF